MNLFLSIFFSSFFPFPRHESRPKVPSLPYLAIFQARRASENPFFFVGVQPLFGRLFYRRGFSSFPLLLPGQYFSIKEVFFAVPCEGPYLATVSESSLHVPFPLFSVPFYNQRPLFPFSFEVDRGEVSPPMSDSFFESPRPR